MRDRVHLALLPVHEDNMCGLGHLDELHDSLGISMSGERQVLHFASHFEGGPSIQIDFEGSLC